MSSNGLVKVAKAYRTVIASAVVLGVCGLVVAFILDAPAAGVFFCVGLGLGYMNSAMVIASGAKFAAMQEVGKRPMVIGALRRLAIITVIALAAAVYYRPDGLALLFGLALFQFIMIGRNAGTLLREVRQV